MRIGFALLAAGAVLASAAPMPAADEDLATVGGKVFYNGQPVTDSVITFHFEDGQFMGAKIKDGLFRVDRVPPGAAKVTIESKVIRLPARFAAPVTSGLKIDVKKGKIAVNLMLSG